MFRTLDPSKACFGFNRSTPEGQATGGKDVSIGCRPDDQISGNGRPLAPLLRKVGMYGCSLVRFRVRSEGVRLQPVLQR